MISEFMIGDHRHCDEYFTRAEQAASQDDLTSAATHFQQFHDSMERHFAMEEHTLFPRIEALSGQAQGPTSVMRAEHQQMRALLAQMAFALEGGEGGDFLDDCETVLILMQQHNMKEENILYPMADQLLAGEARELVEQLRQQDI